MSVDGYTLRRLDAKDARAFRELRIAALSEAPEAFGTSLEEERRKSLRTYQRELAGGKRTADDFLLGVFAAPGTEPALVGVVGFYRQKKTNMQHKGFLWGMYVRDTNRRGGLGRWLLDEAVVHVKNVSELEVLQINVVSINQPAIRLYEDFGFEIYGCERKAFKLDDVHYDIVHMSYDVV